MVPSFTLTMVVMPMGFSPWEAVLVSLWEYSVVMTSESSCVEVSVTVNIPGLFASLAGINLSVMLLEPFCLHVREMPIQVEPVGSKVSLFVAA